MHSGQKIQGLVHVSIVMEYLAKITYLSLFLLSSLCLPSTVSSENISSENISACSRIPQLLSLAEDLRGLSATGSIDCKELEEDAYRIYARQLTESANDPLDFQYQEIVYKILGLVPTSYPYAHCLIQMAGDFGEALYDRKVQQIILRKDYTIPDSILVHEIIHALQDQHFNLRLIRDNVSTSDENLAITALIEGDATLREDMVVVDQKERAETGVMPFSECRPPEPLYSILIFPYEWGKRFASILEEEGKLDQAFIDPPRFSREILYPEEYLAKSTQHDPRQSFKEIPAPGYKYLYSDVLGEYVVRSLFRTFTNRTLAIRAGRGWTNDLIELYQHQTNKRYLLRWRIQFETGSDVDQFLMALKKYSQNHFDLKLDQRATQWSAQTNYMDFKVRPYNQTIIIEISTL